MLTSRAVGGPRNGIKISAMFEWHGRIKQPTAREGAIERWYPGRYIWISSHGQWEWSEDIPKPSQGLRVAQPGGYSK